MTAGGDWGEIIDKEEAERFVGREKELETFRQQINRTPPRYLIFYITGQGGVGKTTLLNRYREIAKDLSFLLADCDELQRDIPAVLGRFAHQLAEQGYSLKRFNERYKTYRQKMKVRERANR
jgi:AAA+ ATPase superfamily predicted ATPase